MRALMGLLKRMSRWTPDLLHRMPTLEFEQTCHLSKSKLSRLCSLGPCSCLRQISVPRSKTKSIERKVAIHHTQPLGQLTLLDRFAKHSPPSIFIGPSEKRGTFPAGLWSSWRMGSSGSYGEIFEHLPADGTPTWIMLRHTTNIIQR